MSDALHLSTFVYMHMCMCVCMCMCVYVHVYVYACVYVCVYVYVHTCTALRCHRRLNRRLRKLRQISLGSNKFTGPLPSTETLPELAHVRSSNGRLCSSNLLGAHCDVYVLVC